MRAPFCKKAGSSFGLFEVVVEQGRVHFALDDTDTMHGQTFFYDSHPPEKALAYLTGAGFEPVVSEFMDMPTGGRDKGRFAVVARRA